MPEDAPLKVEAWPIEKVVAYANNPRKRTLAAVGFASATLPCAAPSSAAQVWRDLCPGPEALAGVGLIPTPPITAAYCPVAG